MLSDAPTYAGFLEAKAEFLETARNAKATDGIIENGHEMEDQLVSNVLSISLTALN
jgi:hypothetical protein